MEEEQGGGSEVARLMRRIELECEAMQRVANGLAITSPHKFINRKYRNIDTAQERLAKIVGEEKAHEIAFGIYMKVIG
jgi:hypothetical protein